MQVRDRFQEIDNTHCFTAEVSIMSYESCDYNFDSTTSPSFFLLCDNNDLHCFWPFETPTQIEFVSFSG